MSIAAVAKKGILVCLLCEDGGRGRVIGGRRAGEMAGGGRGGRGEITSLAQYDDDTPWQELLCYYKGMPVLADR